MSVWRRLLLLAILMCFTVAGTLRVQQVIAGDADWVDGFWICWELVFIVFCGKQLVTPKPIRNSSTERES